MKENILYVIKTVARSYKMINKAIEKQIGCKNWFTSDEDLKQQIIEGFVEVNKRNIVIYWL